MTYTYPFTAFIGQDLMRLGLLLNAVNPKIGGMLIRGEKGTGKSTVVRALAAILPEIDVVEACPFQCNPHSTDLMCPHCRKAAENGPLPVQKRQRKVLELPINATEDRVAGAMDLEHALSTGEKRFEPGILASANRGVLYVDEVNLLDDHIVDILLDSAAMGVNTVEREGVSFTHPARFILVGTMNPEEGDLRPQLLDRFGLSVYVEGILDLDQRDALLRRWEEHESNPKAFLNKWRKRENALKTRIAKARRILPKVKADDSVIRAITEMAVQLGVDGHRADLVILKTAKTHAAFEGRRDATLDDVEAAAKLAVSHRMRRQPFDDVPDHSRAVEKVMDGLRTREQRKKKLLKKESPTESKQDAPLENGCPRERGLRPSPSGSEAAGEVFKPGKAGDLSARTFRMPFPRGKEPEKGRFQKAPALEKRGRYTRISRNQEGGDLALDATLRAAAPYALSRPAGGLAIPIQPDDWRRKSRTHKTGALFVFVVDASGSMGSTLMTQTKAAIMHLLAQAYKDRSEAAMIAFKGRKAEVLLPPTKSINLAERKLRTLPTGGTTPLCAGMALGLKIAKKALQRKRAPWPRIVLVTDGRANIGLDKTRDGALLPLHEEVLAMAGSIGRENHIRSLVLDAEEKHPAALGMAREIARHMNARRVPIYGLQPESIVEALWE
ncbi:magnesium chelatase subunit D [Desulfatibacillum alkenivorans DSM 16219]|jgi:magnesium chelatase subunit D|uniref:Mg-protoporphyrin IX chelatase n=1 Tax=Desulfatibacillum alkenivorans DSM 16219 TaxID=1121393 RepID=A0A1M6YQI3_9BACT|nr:magnesium chelatase subunit D family protein [Desulfatibacillum alkenivorans]SHL20477.1 magnesium chelatase subunit D [Desulfatibacillum alkenivorans DSM 16219]